MLEDQAVHPGEDHAGQLAERHGTGLAGIARNELAPLGDPVGAPLVLPSREHLVAIG